jgi:hypothetical protein
VSWRQINGCPRFSVSAKQEADAETVMYSKNVGALTGHYDLWHFKHFCAAIVSSLSIAQNKLFLLFLFQTSFMLIGCRALTFLQIQNMTDMVDQYP